jgi:hypothetical protein
MYQSEAPPLKTIATDLTSQDTDEELNSTIHPRPPWETLPTMYDLPSENPEEPGLPDELLGIKYTDSPFFAAVLTPYLSVSRVTEEQRPYA